jgi:N-methylhydantoinase B
VATNALLERKGGEGILRECEFLVPVRVTIISDRRKAGPCGIPGGGAGKKGRNSLYAKGRRVALGSKVNLLASPVDLLRVQTPGGGGYGSRARDGKE